ncbi:glycerate kinase type-2 family protein [Arenibaculum pallidiluteum]|uniref:glycerate kinase type-2 family protein n=1 Tax=Arenibaculum pallidiluteum TaxID=2812559 RepID=UPI001A973005|nr:glycerate kinase [Arenibaculum pallidiluteum]
MDVEREAEAARDRDLLQTCFDRAVTACRPSEILAPHLPARPPGRTVAIGAGKAAASMAAALERHWPGPLDGMVVTRHGHGQRCKRLRVVEAGHPNPDEAGQRVAAEMLSLIGGLCERDLVLCLLSGGGSSLLMLPPPGVSLGAVKAVNSALLASGAPIEDMNRVRSVVSRLGGGRLCMAAWPARMVTLAISDVPGDTPTTIASGPTVAPESDAMIARGILKRYDVAVPADLDRFLASSEAAMPAPGHPAFSASAYRLIASGRTALEAAATHARSLGLEPFLLGDAVEGEAREVGRAMAGIAKAVQSGTSSFRRPCLLLSGGETSVTVRGKGRGGRNAEFLLGFALAIEGSSGITAIACDTDGIDGSEDNAGAIADGATVRKARELGLDPRARLASNDAYSVFEATGELVVTGPTLTNVNDFRAILVR